MNKAEARERTIWANDKCYELAQRRKLYKYTLYPLDYLLGRVMLWLTEP
jgi:hypothetical protein